MSDGHPTKTLKEVLAERGLRQKDLAHATGIDAARISNLCKFEPVRTANMADRLVRGFQDLGKPLSADEIAALGWPTEQEAVPHAA